MCGILGFRGEVLERNFQNILQALSHRGPDEEGFYHDLENQIHLGHKRLSIVDLKDGKQPIANEDQSIWVISNSEIYNYKDLRTELILKGHRFQTDHSDTEVLVHGYEEWGENLFHRINGMFALAIYNQPKKQIILARDRFGQKPLFYTQQDEVFMFASELTPFRVNPAVETHLSELSIQKYFAYRFFPAPHTIFQNIYKLKAGHWLRYDLSSNRIDIHKYWNFSLEPIELIPENAEKKWGDELLFLLEQSVQRRLMSDVPVAVFLSGGIDSSAILHYAQHISPLSIDAYGIGFDEKSYDETPYIENAAEHTGSKKNVRIFSLDKMKQVLPQVLSSIDEPLGDPSILPTFLLSQFTAEKYKVALGGDGADELLAGYDPFMVLRRLDLFAHITPLSMKKMFYKLGNCIPVSNKKLSFDFKLKRALKGILYEPELWNSVWLGALGPDEFAHLFHHPLPMEEIYAEAFEVWEECNSDDIVDKTLHFFTKLYLSDDILVKIDRASMLNSLEVRSPFLDIDFVNFIRRIPTRYKLKGSLTKYIFKKALQGILPDSIINRTKKGFAIPLTQWLQSGNYFDSIENYQLDSIRSSAVSEFIFEHKKKKKDHRDIFWNLLTLKYNHQKEMLKI